MNLCTEVKHAVSYMVTGIVLEGFGYGIYCVIFAAFVRIRLKRTNKGSKALLCLVTANFIACTAHLAFSLSQVTATQLNVISVMGGADILYSCVDFISQVILIYRCWIMWRQPWVMVAPILLTLAFSVISVIALAKTPSTAYVTPDWYLPAVLSFFSLSLAANALVTGLIISRILTLYRGIQSHVGHTNGLGLKREVVVPIISILIESGLVTFVAQLGQTLVFRFAYSIAYPIIAGIVVILYGISTTIVLVRVEMGLTYDIDNESLKTAIRFATSQRSEDIRVTTTIEC